MKLGIYSMKDLKIGYGPVFVEQNDATAKRLFGSQISAAGSILNFSPADFQLFRLGEFDSDTGLIESFPPCLILDGYEVIKKG